MTTYERGDVILAALPFSDLSAMKKRPAVVVSSHHPSVDLFLLPITSQTQSLQPGEFVLAQWQEAGLLFPSAVKRGLFTLEKTCITRRLGHLAPRDLTQLDQALRDWLGL
ncbi:MAG: type II toxin-antitoxin system PemK/MazF family toxin [Nitrospirae bacterium]|nr:type II toxin-antitoxin system PemK/MazF family toxin [Nitrospirota bacterium]